MLGVAGTIVVRVGTHYVAIGISLFGFSGVGVAVAVDHIAKFVLGVVLGGMYTGGRCGLCEKKNLLKIGLIWCIWVKNEATTFFEWFW